jgi:hypothetical protein
MAPTPTPTPRRAPTRTAIPTWTPTPTLALTPTPVTGVISGQVIDASDGSPIPQANVQTDPPTVSATTDGSGRYTIAEVAPGTYTITAAKPGYAGASVTIAVTAGKATTADVHLVAAPATLPPSIPTGGGLMAHWSFDDCCGTDISGNGLHGTLQGNPQCVEGAFGKAMEMDGVDDWFSLQDLPPTSYRLLDFSISLWFNTDRDTHQTLWQASDGNTWGLTGHGIALKSLSDIEAGYRAKEPRKCELHALGDLEPDAWHHVILVRDTNAERGFVYIDGNLADTCDDPDPGLPITPQSYPRIGYGTYSPSTFSRRF